ncbi:retrovirus-related pol polyprotein from transposon TNT 1-94, partial [Tanacetum coccineum]
QNANNQIEYNARQFVGNQNRYKAVQNAGNQIMHNAVQNPSIQDVGNQNGLIVFPRIANQNGNGNVVAARAEGNGNGNNGNQIRCYNCRGVGHYARNCTVRPRRRDAAYLQTQLLIAQKEEAGIQLQAKEFDLMATTRDIDEIETVNANCILMANLQQASTSGTQTDKAPIYDSDGSAEIFKNEIAPIVNQVDVRLQNFEIQFFKEASKFVRDFKSLAKEADESLDKIKVLEYKNERLLRAVVSQDIMAIDEVFSTWMTFGGNTRDLGSFGEETEKTTDLHQNLLKNDAYRAWRRRRRLQAAASGFLW